MSVTVQLTLVNGDASSIPAYAKDGDAGCDAKANLKEPVIVFKDKPTLIPLGIKTAIPEGYAIQVLPRSGVALKNGVTVLNTPGLIDGNYRGELGAILINHTHYPFTVNNGDRICQLICIKVEKIQWEIVEELTTTERGDGGFGHSGVSNV